ncbi:cytochrome P450 71A3-like [Olea europaea var. sylvestris]|uniref:Cytochrome P450 71A6-like n=1 Tax=Olea europaea subsp. europaea TaxID=158383 RepID=A0A8S0R8A6_OLEEU|nr:cytochrome P450 71A3-like isoform X3 [Olea europaea var. sylvestris]XP_022871956.1 cytochrome P450 71A3-like [Olea europaea var. sylvestris]CAA2974621.1 cytochrome P450 71A6-like [Olea europaea subsp. europaea]CAA2989607.1 cytochrome P450 71A6-like [Olea europaea subsp. europaea]
MSSFLQLLLPFASFFLFTILVFKWYFNPASTAGKRIPSPPKLPVIGNLHQLGLFPHRALQALSKRYGPIMMLHLGSVPAVIVSSAEGAREIMKTHDLVFSNRPKVSIPDKIVYGSKDIAFAPYGEHWRQVRSICVLHLLSFKRVQSFRYIREEETDLMIQKIRQSSTSPTSVTNLSNLLVSVTNDTICRVALGRKYSDGEADGSNKFELMLKEIMEIAGTFNVGDYIPWLKWMNMVNGLDARVDRLAKTFDKFLSSIVEEHRSRRKQENSSNATDLVDLLLEIQSEKKTSFTLDDETMKSVIFDMFAAGTDTTYTSLEWTVTEVLRHPKVMKKLQNEVRQVAGGKSEITEDDLEKMPYLKAVMKESLRLHPSIPLLVPRESTQDTKVMGYNIPTGTQVMVNAWAIARDPKEWENPEEFNPERFFNNTEVDFRGFNFEYIPFGAGRRGCPGITFAMAVNEFALAKLMLNFNFALPIGAKDWDLLEAVGSTVHKKHPLLVVATPCSS